MSEGAKGSFSFFLMNRRSWLERIKRTLMLSGYMDTSGGAVPATVSEELAASISMQEQEKKRETLFGTIIGNGGDDDVRNNE